MAMVHCHKLFSNLTKYFFFNTIQKKSLISVAPMNDK